MTRPGEIDTKHSKHPHMGEMFTLRALSAVNKVTSEHFDWLVSYLWNFDNVRILIPLLTNIAMHKDEDFDELANVEWSIHLGYEVGVLNDINTPSHHAWRDLNLNRVTSEEDHHWPF